MRCFDFEELLLVILFAVTCYMARCLWITLFGAP